MNVVYFAQDLRDEAVARRVMMMVAGGASVTLLGFRRSPEPIKSVAGVDAIDLGKTFDGKLLSRFGLVARRALESRRWRSLIKAADVILARNLEMAEIADAARGWAGNSVPLVYECLDIHQSLLKQGLPSRLLRDLECRILRRSTALMVSSNGFITNYFKSQGVVLPKIILAENKRVILDENVTRPAARIHQAPPWKIGWYGILRCTQSFEMLMGLANRYPALIDVSMRGRPTDDVQALILKHLPIMSNMRFDGLYVPSELELLYNNVHFTWAIDYFQKGQNSDWLLPNRIYEGGFYNCPAIALAGTETAGWLIARKAGLIVETITDIESYFSTLSLTNYAIIQQSTVAIRDSDLIYRRQDCVDFVSQLNMLETV